MGNMFPGMPGGTPRSLQVMFTDEWTGGYEGLKIFGRLSALFAVENLQASGVTVYLIDGHQITEQQEAKLAEWVGHTRLVRRGAVALGIVGDARIIGGGVLIGEVSPGGTADRGGLRGGDLLLAMEPAKQPTPKVAESDKPSVNPSNDAPAKNKLTPEVPDSEVPDSEVLAIEDVKGDEDAPVIVELDDLSQDRYLSGDKRRLRDFDDLVERLKGYKIDDEITLHVIRGYERYRMNLMFGGRRFNIPDDGAPPDRGALKVELVKVKLKGWKDVQVLQ